MWKDTRTDLLGSGVTQGGERAHGGSALGGILRKGELQNGIHHALTMTLPRRLQRLGPVWPASAQDDNAARDYAGHVPIGQLVALPSSVDVHALGLSKAGLAIAIALQDYGAYNVDSATDFSLSAEPAVEPDLGAREDLPKLRALLLCVTNNRKDNVGGGGPRRKPPALPLLPAFVIPSPAQKTQSQSPTHGATRFVYQTQLTKKARAQHCPSDGLRSKL